MMRRHGTLSISQWSVSGKSRSLLLLARGLPRSWLSKELASDCRVRLVKQDYWWWQMFTPKYEALTAGDLRETCIEVCG